MRFVDLKNGLRVVVTHRSSKDKGRIGTIVRVPAQRTRCVVVNLDGVRGLRYLHWGSINPVPVKAPEKRPEPLSAGEIGVGTHLRYKGGLPQSGRCEGDVYVVTEIIEHDCCPDNDRVWYKYKSGTRPNQTWEEGCLVRDTVLKYWEIIA